MSADEQMKKPWPLLALGIGTFLILALITLPASVALSFAHPAGVTFSGVSGTIWKGRVEAVRSGATHVGSIDWDLHILSLFARRLGADVKIKRTDGFAQGSLTAAPGGRLTLRKFSASLPVSALPPNIVRGGWTGALNIQLSELVLYNAWPVALNGTVVVADLVGPANRPAALGG